MSIPYDSSLVESIGMTLDLREPNIRALDQIAKALNAAQPGEEFVVDLATGVGKTYIAGALIDYLAEAGVRNVVIITPGSTIQRKTIANLTPGNSKYLKGMSSNPLVITLDDLERGSVATALEDSDRMKVFIFTVQSLLRPDTADARRAHREHETLGQALYQYLQDCTDLVVIADEHHIYYSGSAKRFQAAIDELHPLAMVGLTATPTDKSSAKIIYHYPIASAIADGYVKIPVLVARSDGKSDLQTQMSDGVALLNAKAAAMSAYCRQIRRAEVKPVMFVVAKSIDEANELKGILSSPGLIGDPNQVLLVTSEEPDETLEELDALEDPSSPYRAVVSVSMLKEGWDVKNIYVIASVRAMESQLLTEQILGRGLRLPFGIRTGVPMLDTVEVLSHHAFSDLLRSAKILLQETFGERAAEATAVVDAVGGVTSPLLEVSDLVTATSIDSSEGSSASTITFTIGLVESTTDQPGTLFGTSISQGDPSFALSTLEARLASGLEETSNLVTTLEPRALGKVQVPLFLPKLTKSIERPKFSLTQINATEVEALGRTFAQDPGSRLTRKGIEAVRDEVSGSVTLDFRDETDVVAATSEFLPFDLIETDLASNILNSNGVEASLVEENGAVAIARSFLRGAGITPKTSWRPEHGKLATAKLVEWIGNLQATITPREVISVTLTPWPEPPERFERKVPADRHLITKSSLFERGYPYKGWNKSIYSIVTFDAFSTEFRLAEIFEKSADVEAWLRIEDDVPLQIEYKQGSLSRLYRPDLVVIDMEGDFWMVEGKADKDLTDPNVLAKREAAHAWVASVNSAANINQKWGYLLASETVIGGASSWAELKAGAQVYT